MPRSSLHLDPPQLTAYPGHMPVPTMLSRSEVDYLYALAASRYSGRGRIVDMGCFFGGSTMPLAAGLAANESVVTKPDILTYDSFVMDADTAPRFPVGLSAGESFRPIFERYLRDHLPCITIREGWIPTELQPGDERRLYPEQEPVEILFIDLAKLWPVHDTILRVFGPRLIPGVSVVVQQDFKHHGTYWLGLHMLQLRDCFEPLHDIPGGASVSFLYKGGLETELPALVTRADIPAALIDRAWQDVDAYWSARGRAAIRLIMKLAAATHLADAGRFEESVECLRLFDDEFKPEPADPNATLLQTDFLSAVERVARATRHPAALELLARLNTQASRPDAQRESRRHAAIDRCLAAGHHIIALYGAGRHTATLLGSGWPHGRLSISAILDDHSLAKEIAGIPVVRPSDVPPHTTAILISSDASEDALYRAALAANLHRPIFRIYS